MISLLLGSFLSTAQAVPMQLSQQGRLVDSSGVAAAGNHNLTFRLYNAGTGGTLLWNETVSTNFTNGYYSVVLGSDTINNPLEDSVLESGDLYIEIEIDSDGPLTPRSAVTSAPFARVAGKAQVADSVDWSGLTSVPSGLDDADTRLAALEALMTTVQSDLATANTTISTLQSDLATTQNDLATAQSDLATANTTISSLESSLAGNTTDIASNTSSINALETDLTSAEASIATLQTDLSGISDNVLDMISVDTTWNIGTNGDYTDLVDAMAAARSVRIHPDATLTLQMANDIYTLTETVNLNHPDGLNIKIQGNTADSSLVKIVSSNDIDAFFLSEGHNFRGVFDLTIEGDGTANGILVENASITLSNIVIDGLANGINAKNQAYVYLSGVNTIQNSANLGLNVQWNSTVRGEDYSLSVLDSASHGVHTTHSSLVGIIGLISNGNNYGVVAADTATVYAPYGEFMNNSTHGVTAYRASSLFVENATISDNTGFGAQVQWNSNIRANGATFSGNGSYGVSAEYTSSLYCNNCTVDSNYYGVGTHWSSSTYANGMNISNSTQSGLYVSGGSGVYVKNGTISGNAAYGMNLYNNSYTNELGMTYSGNSAGNFNLESGSMRD